MNGVKYPISVMGSNERREREKEKLRAKILDAARELFAEHGYEAVTMRKIADRIEYSPTALYFHFKDKSELIRALCNHDFQAFAQRLVAVASVPDPIERLLKASEAYVAFGLEHPNHYRLMFMTPRLYDVTEAKASPEHADENAYAFLKSMVAAAIDAGRVRPDLTDVELVAQILWSAIHGVVSLHIAKADARWIDMKDPRVLAKEMCSILMRGIAR
jgi:AcrR family transcriptional regulator